MSEKRGFVHSVQHFHRLRKKDNLPWSEWKYFKRWFTDSRPSVFPLHAQLPWITYGAIEFISGILRPDMTVFEFGSGGSTIFYSNRVGKVVSVEHDKGWSEIVEKHIAENELKNVEFHFVQPEDAINESTEFSNPAVYRSPHVDMRNKTFHNYVTVIDRFDDRTFNLVSVDGRSRPSCIKHALPKISIGGYLLLDNSERDYYLKHFDTQTLNGNYELVFKYRGAGPYGFENFWQTTIWKRLK